MTQVGAQSDFRLHHYQLTPHKTTQFWAHQHLFLLGFNNETLVSPGANIALVDRAICNIMLRKASTFRSCVVMHFHSTLKTDLFFFITIVFHFLHV